MYDTIKLEKGLYNLSGKSFTQALEAADPSENYKDTPLSGLDAFERQLKRFDIKVSGENCDKVDKFFVSTESAVLFPEFVKRAVMQGMEDSILGDMVSVTTKSDCNQFRGYLISEATPYTQATTEGNALPETSIKEGTTTINLLKYGRAITASYEVVRLQRLDSFAKCLKAIGRKLAGAMVKSALTTLAVGSDEIKMAGTAIAFSDLLDVYGEFTDYNMNTLIVAPSTAAQILAMSQVSDNVTMENGKIVLPFGATMLKTNQLDGTSAIAIDREYALEMITSSDLVMETDKLIDRQLDVISVSMNMGFKKFMPGSVKILDLSE